MAQAESLPQSFTYASAVQGKWELKARTDIEWFSQRPDGSRMAGTERVECQGTSPDIDFRLDGSGRIESLRFRFLGLPDQDGERNESTLLGDRLWLLVDDERWEFANVLSTSRFSNVPDAVTSDEQTEDEQIVVMPWRGHQAVRKNGTGPWLHISRLYERVIAARTLNWGFKSRDWTVVDKSIEENALPVTWKTRRYAIERAGLPEAINWCAELVRSELAYVLPAELLRHTKK